MNPVAGVAGCGTSAPVAGVALLRLPRSFPCGSTSLSVARGSAMPPRGNPCGSRRGAWHFSSPLRGAGLECHAPVGRAVDSLFCPVSNPHDGEHPATTSLAGPPARVLPSWAGISTPWTQLTHSTGRTSCRVRVPGSRYTFKSDEGAT